MADVVGARFAREVEPLEPATALLILVGVLVAALGDAEAPAPAVDALTGEIREDGDTTDPAEAGG